MMLIGLSVPFLSNMAEFGVYTESFKIMASHELVS